MVERRLKAILFDLDDTLYPEIDFISHVFEKVAERICRDFGIRGGKRYIFRDMMKHFLEVEKERIFDWIVEEKTHLKGGEVGVYVRQVLLPIYRNARPSLKPFPDTIPVLEKLRKGYILGLLTNGRIEVQGWKIDSIGVRDYFSRILITEELGDKSHWKPSPEPFLVLLDRLGVDAARSLYIGDNPELDFTTPASLGIKTVRISRPNGIFRNLEDPFPLPDYHIETLETLPDIIEDLENNILI